MPELSTEFIEELTKKLRAIGSLKAVGDTWVSFDSSVPPGGVPFCGQTVSRALYADLLTWATAQGKMKSEEDWQAYAAANGGNCPYYSEGDSLTTFRMPCVLGYLRGSSVTTEGGTYKPQKLPNLKGAGIPSEAISAMGNFPPRTGVFYDITSPSNYRGFYNTDEDNGQIAFNAHLYDERYEDGADVQPETFHVLVGVYAVGVITNINNTDVSQLQTGLATLEANAVKSVNNTLPVSGNVTLDLTKYRWAKPNKERVYNKTFPYKAESDGVWYIKRNLNGGTVSPTINGIGTVDIDYFSCLSLPFKKGDLLAYSSTLTNNTIIFNETD